MKRRPVLSESEQWQRDLYNRYIQKLNKQEDRLESLVEAIDGARARRKKAEDAFADYVSKLRV